jgi:PIN domain nuclease of toxin-antitoxin system
LSALILDTHIALWWLADDGRLSPRLRELIAKSTDVCLSSASTWEVAIKLAIGKLRLDLDPDTTFASVCAQTVNPKGRLAQTTEAATVRRR